MKKAGIFTLFMLLNLISVTAQEAGTGKPIIVLFGDYTAGLGTHNDVSGFNLTRSRLGYEYQVLKDLKATVVLDINTLHNGNRSTYFHYAMLEWTYQKLELSGGLIYLSQFEVQEAFWGRRYIEKSFQDRYGFGHDSDLGIKARYHFTDWLNADFAITNGEGTLNINNNNSYKYGLGITLKPTKELTFRAYADLYSDSQNLRPELDAEAKVSFTDQKTAAIFAGYSDEQFSLGIEYNYQMNREFVDGCDYYGFSVYGGLPLSQKLGWFGRYDYVDTQTADGIRYGWTSIAHKNALVTGFEYYPIRQLAIAPNYRYAETFAGDKYHTIGVNVGFSW